MAFLGIVQNDIKRVVAYSTLSQLGYMTVALGASAYSVAIFHLMTHAFFKALLFLGAGSVIIALHHEQDLRRMGGLRKFMPITYWTAVIGSLALAGIPPFAGFFSKDSIIEAVHASKIPGHGYAYFAVTVGVFITAFYSFRMLFLAFHGKERFGGGHDVADRRTRARRPCRAMRMRTSRRPRPARSRTCTPNSTVPRRKARGSSPCR
jgi:NADH-quinone oxidoreductase subunit L